MTSRRGAFMNKPSLSGASGPGESGNGFGALPLLSASLELGPDCGFNAAGTSGIPALEGSLEPVRGRVRPTGGDVLPLLSAPVVARGALV